MVTCNRCTVPGEVMLYHHAVGVLHRTVTGYLQKVWQIRRKKRRVKQYCFGKKLAANYSFLFCTRVQITRPDCNPTYMESKVVAIAVSVRERCYSAPNISWRGDTLTVVNHWCSQFVLMVTWSARTIPWYETLALEVQHKFRRGFQ